MENENLQITEEPKINLEITENGQKSLISMASWMLFFAILTSVGIGFMLIGAISMLAMSAFTSVYNTMPGGFTPMMSLIYLIMAAGLCFPTYFLYASSSKIKKAIQVRSNEMLDEALLAVKNYWKAYGIATIVMIALVIILMIIFMFMAVKAGMSGVI